MPGQYVTNSTASVSGVDLSIPLDTDKAAIGDLMIAMLAFDLSASPDSTLTVTPPDGWTIVRSDLIGSSGAKLAQVTYYKVAAAGDSVFTWESTSTVNIPIVGTCLVYRYMGPSTFIDASAGPGTPSGTTSIYSSSVNATQNNDLILTLFSMTGTVPDDVALQAPQTIRADIGALGMRIVTGDELRGQDEATGQRLLSSADNIGACIAHTVALRSAPFQAVMFQDNYKSKVLRQIMPKPYDARLATTLGKLLTVIGTDDNNIGGLFGAADFLPDETV